MLTTARTLLTSPSALGNTDLPQTRQGVTDASLCPKQVRKSGLFCFVSNPATGASCGRCYILAEHVSDSVRAGRPCLGRGACSVFFCAPIPKQDRFPMIRFILSSRFLRFKYRLSSLAWRVFPLFMLAVIIVVALAPELLIAGVM